LKRLGFCALLAVSGCVSVPYDNIPRGEFSGLVMVVWVGPNDASFLGDGEFLYVPVKGRELTFVRSDAANPSGNSKVIQPKAFYTDGGSVPRVVQSARGFNAWGYGPAYIIHDWIFVAKKCLNDADLPDHDQYLNDEVMKISEMRFRESASIMGETIKTLVRDNDIDDGDSFSGPVITSITSGPVTRRLWNETGKCAENQVKSEHQAVVDKLSGTGVQALRQSESVLIERSATFLRKLESASFETRVDLGDGLTAFAYGVASLDTVD
jgi:hypothetical protein